MKFERSSIPDEFPNCGDDPSKAAYYRNNLNQALEEGYAEFEQLSLPAFGKYRFHPNINLYLDVTTRCPYDCGFCIAKTTDNRKRAASVKLHHIKDAVDYLESGGFKPSIQVTGGEPLLHPEINAITDYVTSRKVTSVINTNLIPSNHIDALKSYDHVNASCHHYRESLNSEIMNGKRSFDRLAENIQRVGPSKLRLQCNLIGGYIDTFGEIMQFIAWGYHKLGVSNFSFSWLTALPDDTMYDRSIIDYVLDRPVPEFPEIVEQVANAGHWQFKKYRGGVACYYELWEYTAYDKPVLVQFKYSDNAILDRADKDPVLCPDLILHPDGTLTGSWDTRVKVIYKPSERRGEIYMPQSEQLNRYTSCIGRS